MIVAFVCFTLPYSLKKVIPGLTLSTVSLVTIIIVVIIIIVKRLGLGLGLGLGIENRESKQSQC